MALRLLPLVDELFDAAFLSGFVLVTSLQALADVSLRKVQVAHSIRRGSIGRHGIEGFCTTNSTGNGASIEFSDGYKCKTKDTRPRRVDPVVGECGDWLSVAVEERTLKTEIPEKGDQ